MKAEVKKVQNIENTVKKSNIRLDIISQATQWLVFQSKVKKPIEELKGATLSGDKAYFEGACFHHLTTSPFLKHKPRVSFDCAEKKSRKIALKAMTSLPINSHMYYGDYNDLFKKEFVRKDGAMFAKSGKATNPNIYNFVWADYCCPASKKLVKEFINTINNNVNTGVVYLTFCGHTRAEGGRKTLVRQFADVETTEDANITRKLNAKIIKAIKNEVCKDVKLIYNVIYGGGQHGTTTMMTIGFSVNLPKNVIVPIADYRQGKTQDEWRIYRMANSLSARNGWKLKERKKTGRKRKSWRSVERIAEMKAEIKRKNKLRKKIRTRLNRGWNSVRIADDLKIPTRVVGAMRSWINPKGKLFSKLVNA